MTGYSEKNTTKTCWVITQTLAFTKPHLTLCQEMTTTNAKMDVEILASIDAMRVQEETGYAVSDYLRQIPHSDHGPLKVDSICRTQMADWCNTMTDLCKYSRETTEIAMSCLDRFVSTADGFEFFLDRNQFQLAAMAAFYTAAKVHERQALDPRSVAKLSRGLHSKEDIEAMEFRMLNAIQWRVNPPTAMSFARHLLDLVPSVLIDGSTRDTTMELAKYQVELAVCCYNLSLEKSSLIAFASLLNSIESIETRDGTCSAYFESMASSILKTDMNRLRLIQMRLYEAVSRQSDSEPMSALLTQKKYCTTSKRSLAAQTFTRSSRRLVSISIV
jgi:hypothetical protein